MSMTLGLLAGAAALLGAETLVRTIEKRIGSKEETYAGKPESTSVPATQGGIAGTAHKAGEPDPVRGKRPEEQPLVGVGAPAPVHEVEQEQRRCCAR